MSELRSGYTTGTCAAAAAKAAVLALAGKGRADEVEIMLPEGDPAILSVAYVQEENGKAVAAVRKDAGDDPDITDGVTIIASVAWREGEEIVLLAGDGVGTVTKPGLQIKPGEPAINPVPRRMVRDAVRSVTDRGVAVTLSIPEGKERAARTFNPRLGIVGGLSIIGTSGRVRPFSCPALRASLKCVLDVAAAGGVTAPVFVPGHIGERAAKRHFQVEAGQVVEVSNEWGFMLDCAAEKPFEALMALGHPGKLAKLAMGEWDTHSSRSKSAVPLVLELGGQVLGRRLDDSNTVEGIFAALPEAAKKELGHALAGRIRLAVGHRVGKGIAVAVVLVDMQGNWLGCDGDLQAWRRR